MESETDFQKKIKEEMSVNYANALEKNFEIAKSMLRITSTGTVEILDKSKFKGTDLLLLYMIGKRYASEANLSESEFVSSNELVRELGLKIGSVLPWLKSLRDNQFLEIRKGKHSIKINFIEGTLERLKNGSKETIFKKRNPNNLRKNNPKKIKKKSSTPLNVDIEEVYKKLENHLGISINKLKEIVIIHNDGSFKFDKIPSGSKMARQRTCILLTGAVLFYGFDDTVFNSYRINKVCKDSYVDASRIDSAFTELKKADLVSKNGAGSKMNYLKEEGKKEAKKIIKGLTGE